MTSDRREDDAWQEILDKALGGDAEALGLICQQHLRPKTYSFALKFLKNPHDAEDVVQDVFEKILNNYQRITAREMKRFEAFVIAMTKNACIDWKRKQKPTESIDEKQLSENSTLEEIAHKEMLELLCNTVQQSFNENEQRIFNMRIVEELSYQKIADAIGINLTTLYYQYKTILARIGENVELRAYWTEIQG